MENVFIYTVDMIHEQKLRQLVQVFLEENKKLNLSAFRTQEHCWEGNILDSVALPDAFGKIPELAKVTSVVDVGTGGGFPLLPLAIEMPTVRFVGIDATAKKIDAVQRIVAAMDLQNVSLMTGRIEELGHQKELRGQFDLATARALAEIPVLLEYMVPLLRIGGLCALWKSNKVADELASSVNAQKALRVSFVGSFEYRLSAHFGARQILFFRKTAETSEEYPRKTGIPKNKPL